jgi:asparagine synthase (glutamine-hydrolysing)
MCGIYFTNNLSKINSIDSILNKINYRGPDNKNFKIINSKILAHLRLSIIDLDNRSNQPFTFGHFHIIFNGEIYNYLELKNLIKDKYQFNTKSDTEVLLYLFIEFGHNCLNYLNGMFSFVIYNELDNTLFAARDRFGKKPMFYKFKDNFLEISSQPSQLLNKLSDNVNYDKLNEFFAFKYIKEPFTFWNDIYKLPAGSFMRFNFNHNTFEITKYWSITSQQKVFVGNYEDAKHELLYLLNDSIKLRHISDRPVCVNLSGGVDSSLIAILSKLNNKEINTFNVSFDHSKFDESVYAKLVSKKINSNHYDVNFNINDIIYFLDNYSKFFDEPFSDPSSIPSLILSKYINKNNFTVTLSGDGADELFMGYPRYKYINITNHLFNLINYKFRKLLPKLSNNNYFKYFAESNIYDAYIRLIIGKFNSELVNFENLNYNFNNYSNYNNIIDKVSLFDLDNYLINDINVKIDRSMMANSIEPRAPFLDYRIAEFALSLPTKFKYGKYPKMILKDILELYMPKNFVHRNKKGFTASFESLFKTELKDYVLEKLDKESCEKYLPFIDYKLIKKILDDFYINSINRYTEIFSLLVIRNFFNN